MSETQAVVSFLCDGLADSTGAAAGRQLGAGSTYGRLNRNKSLALETALDQLSRGATHNSHGTPSKTHRRPSSTYPSPFQQRRCCADRARHTPSRTPSITLLCIGAGAHSYEMRKVAYVYLAGLLASSAVALVAMTAVFPWWRQTRPAIPALPVLQLAVAVMTPIVFIIGFAGCGSVAAALREATSELRTLAAQIC